MKTIDYDILGRIRNQKRVKSLQLEHSFKNLKTKIGCICHFHKKIFKNVIAPALPLGANKSCLLTIRSYTSIKTKTKVFTFLMNIFFIVKTCPLFRTFSRFLVKMLPHLLKLPLL